jgi:nucleotide-binding universal stress UspA family protein
MMAMAGTNTGDTAHVTELDPPPLAVRPLAVAHVVVPLDGSPFAERALPVGAWIAAAVGGDVHVVEVVPCDADEEAEAAIRYLDSVARSHSAAAWDVIERDDVGAALVDATDGSPGRLACLATHGAGRSLLLGSVAVSLLERSRQPVVMVGPVARAVTAVDAPIVVAVDGMVGDDVLVRVALGWAARLGRRLDVVTVAEPAPPGYLGGARMRRVRGPAQPEPYVASLVARAEGAGVLVTSQVIYDPVGVRDGLVPFLNRTAALVVLGSRHRPGLGRMVPGTHAVHIVHDAAVPAVVVPLPPEA